MSHRFAALIGTLGAVVLILLGVQEPVAAQAASPSGPKKAVAANSTVAAKVWTPPRTPDGQPDLQGIWTTGNATPFERPKELEGKEFFANEKEAVDFERSHHRDRGAGHYDEEFFEYTGVTLRTSEVVYPPDGKIPPLTPDAAARRDYNVAHKTDSYKYLTTDERCITRGIPAVMFHPMYNHGLQILQTPGYVVITYEMSPRARIIPLDGRPHASPDIRLWNGDSRGHWEGNTLVVDVTNYTDEGSVRSKGLRDYKPNDPGSTTGSGGATAVGGVRQSDALHVVERFTPVDANTINYQVTIDDPKTYTSVWKVELPMNRDEKYRMYEYACHEANYGMVDMLAGARAEEQAEVSR